MRPRIGVEICMVYRECRCGNWCATGEGAIAPTCGECGEAMYPAGTAMLPGGDPQFGPKDDPREQRRIRGLGFRATLANEIALFEGKPLDVAVRLADMAHAHRQPDAAPYLTELEAAGAR